MDPTFHCRVLDELRTLLSDLEVGLRPSNLALAEAVWASVRAGMEREKAAALRRGIAA